MFNNDAWWDKFYADRTRPVPFFVAAPDESLATWISEGVIAANGKALDLGCGNGRNAIFMARSGFEVEAVDFSGQAIAWAEQHAKDAGVLVRLHHASVFDAPIVPGRFDLVYDSGCFHHMPPHSRAAYIDLVAAALKPGGWFGMNCFRPEGGSGLSDDEANEGQTLGGGLGYTEARLRELWSRSFEIVRLRQMRACPAGGGLFGEAFLWVMLARKT